MVRLSKYKIKDDVRRNIFKLFFEVVGKQRNKEEFFSIIFDLISPTEQIMIAKRIAVMYLILKKINYVIICDVLKVSTASIAKYTFILDRSRELKQLLIGINKNESGKMLLKEFFSSLFGPGTYGVDWKAARKFQSLIKIEKERGI